MSQCFRDKARRCALTAGSVDMNPQGDTSALMPVDFVLNKASGYQRGRARRSNQDGLRSYCNSTSG